LPPQLPPKAPSLPTSSVSKPLSSEKIDLETSINLNGNLTINSQILRKSKKN
jgi:hypothetical protein